MYFSIIETICFELAVLPDNRSHDLWLVDERFAFTRAFSSDERIDKIIKDGGNADRPDLFIWDLAHGLGSIDPDKKETNVDTSESLKKVVRLYIKWHRYSAGGIITTGAS